MNVGAAEWVMHIANCIDFLLGRLASFLSTNSDFFQSQFLLFSFLLLLEINKYFPNMNTSKIN